MSHPWYFVLLVTAGAFTYVSACTCADQTPQQVFCKSNFANVFKINDNGTVIRDGSQRVYDVDLLYHYRTIVPKNDPDATKLYTYEGESWCGVRFVQDAYYVVAGYYRTPTDQVTEMWTNFCFLQLYFTENPLMGPLKNTFVLPPCNETTTGPEFKINKEPIF